MFLQEDLSDNPELIERYAEAARNSMQKPGPAVYVGNREYPWPEGWLRLRPKILMVGVGCNKGTPAEEILELLENTFKRFQVVVAVPAHSGNHCCQEGRAGFEGSGGTIRS